MFWIYDTIYKRQIYCLHTPQEANPFVKGMSLLCDGRTNERTEIRPHCAFISQNPLSQVVRIYSIH